MTLWRRDVSEEQPDAAASALLEARAKALRDKPAALEADDAVYWVAEFPLGDDQLGVPLEAMRAALPLKGVTQVPLARSQVLGILRFQGEVITVLSLASLLGNPGWREDPQTLLVLELGGGRLVAIDCEQIPKATALPLRLVEAARASRVGSAPTLDLRTNDKRLIRLLDIHKLLDRRRERRDED